MSKITLSNGTLENMQELVSVQANNTILGKWLIILYHISLLAGVISKKIVSFHFQFSHLDKTILRTWLKDTVLPKSEKTGIDQRKHLKGKKLPVINQQEYGVINNLLVHLYTLPLISSCRYIIWNEE